MRINENKQGQVTIFIIIGIILVVAVGIIFLIRFEKIPSITEKPEKNPNIFIEGCIENKMRENINLVLKQGGFIEPKNYKLHKDIKVAYLCENRGQFEPCINQHPMFLNEISKELKENIVSEVRECFNEFKNSLEKDAYEVDMKDNMEINVSLGPGKVYLDIMRDIKITKNKETSTFNKMRLYYQSYLYNSIHVLTDIIQYHLLKDYSVDSY